MTGSNDDGTIPSAHTQTSPPVRAPPRRPRAATLPLATAKAKDRNASTIGDYMCILLHVLHFFTILVSDAYRAVPALVYDL